MSGSLRLEKHVLYVGLHALTAEVASFDLDGRPLETRFRFRDEEAGRSSVDGIDIDDDRRIWVADAAARKVRCFTLFGQEIASVGGGEPERDARGALGAPVDLRVTGTDDDTIVLVASAGERRHGLQALHIASGRGHSIAPLGDPEGRFQRIRGIDVRNGVIAVCEAGAARVQVFDGDIDGRATFRFSFPVDASLGLPEAVGLVGDGRIVVATRANDARREEESVDRVRGVHLFDAAGRHARVIAGPETVDAILDLAIERSTNDRRTLLAVLDQEGARVKILSLDGRDFGSFVDFGPVPLEG